MLRLNCDRWSTLPVVLQMRRQAKPRIHRLLPDRVAGRWKGWRVECTYRDAADRWVAVPFPIKGGAATWAKMKSDAVTAVGVALVNLPLTVKPHLLFRKRRAEVEGRAGATLASLAIAQINPIRFTRGNYSKRAAMALPDRFHRLLPTQPSLAVDDPVGCRRAAF
jgi:hypothetical protein